MATESIGHGTIYSLRLAKHSLSPRVSRWRAERSKAKPVGCMRYWTAGLDVMTGDEIPSTWVSMRKTRRYRTLMVSQTSRWSPCYTDVPVQSLGIRRVLCQDHMYSHCTLSVDPLPSDRHHMLQYTFPAGIDCENGLDGVVHDSNKPRCQLAI